MREGPAAEGHVLSTRRTTFALVAAAAVFAPALAVEVCAATVTVGADPCEPIWLSPNTPGQTVFLYVHAAPGEDADVGVFNLFAQVGDGGPEKAQYGLEPGTDAPAIAAVDLQPPGGVFAGMDANAEDQDSIPQVAVWTMELAGGAKARADGLLATLTLDTTGFFSGCWDLKLSDVLGELGPFDTNFEPDLQPEIVNNVIAVLEESMTADRPGDVNLDGSVDRDDLGILAAHFGGAGGWPCGDLDGDGRVGPGDYAVYKGHYGATYEPASPPAVPEPAVLLPVLFAATLRRRRRAWKFRADMR